MRGRDPNLFYDPVTGYNLDPAIFGRPNPAYGELQWMESTGKTETMLLSTSFTRRFKNNFQGGVTYTRTLKRTTTRPASASRRTTSSTWMATGRARPTSSATRSGRMGSSTCRGRSPSPRSYFYGSGSYYNATLSGRPYSKPGTNRLNLGAPIVIPAAVLDRWEGPDVIATGAVWPRNALRGLPLHKVDMRVSKTHQARRQRAASTLLGEVFNVFNRKNFGSYTTQLDSASFGQPVATSGNAYVPRSGQLGFRFEF